VISIRAERAPGATAKRLSRLGRPARQRLPDNGSIAGSQRTENRFSIMPGLKNGRCYLQYRIDLPFPRRRWAGITIIDLFYGQ
jgi:hypothetical protein